ncbi:pirin family protein [Dyadobacter sp. CY345]|uniref:pirin family protein n=1 Tax=Dyadobacter sp. CY345 TaxID=2909335 RepID=UPI001F406079|nr:pirin family protein [Dyadobacter sp. CY345]MCF2443952.1 pirin family protein [Dyadobacter sp. CY345]
MKIKILKSADRGQMKHDEFEGRTLFSNGMASNILPQSFGALYVFNDDILYPKSHLGMHPHKNVEIVTVMISCTESHRDTLGAHEEYHAGNVQLISSGEGLYHEGGNVSETDNARHLQIWVAPRELNLTPSVKVLNASQIAENTVSKLLVSPDGDGDSLKIQQDVWMYQMHIKKDQAYTYSLHKDHNGVLIYVLHGGVLINGVEVQKEDTALITESDVLEISAQVDSSEIFLIETVL